MMWSWICWIWQGLLYSTRLCRSLPAHTLCYSLGFWCPRGLFPRNVAKNPHPPILYTIFRAVLTHSCHKWTILVVIERIFSQTDQLSSVDGYVRYVLETTKHEPWQRRREQTFQFELQTVSLTEKIRMYNFQNLHCSNGQEASRCATSA